ncbi:xanthine dehydrogenase family protein molybdopterin-binding subunit [Serratia entomophila]|uniref:Xanthine dehydrogenase family protein molybdopterin-binding subunit n=1 Tax=Serratia entomophila TaxID=42906 RepID=A0ABY5CL73_9GAMM|nr:molybdopterin cofactor-binding domain-containing protein [Serratia entomophila]USU98808.1 xanthine dehydrogenase family protein molybdopterin-binding subunit [Serratia entomophila]CAI0799651.1 Membrane-bound aldehyde dehydrogenase [pyrroloquinoline-quinone] precursor [Serratia entomophila]CAI0809904.1 Membrane-bound aldehyde dehydrogenase [pyrroloquinoline-quinone] precursor [Serratia entomophila]CAI0814555.1 Membrane-bound aldehyde dehydrogenase [pyrroloquinoline-quinone] precursor [Serrati
MSRLDVTRRQLLQAGGLVMVSSLLPTSLSAFAAEPAAKAADLPLDRLDSFISLTADGRVTAFNGHVDLGTGIRTALAQIVADEIGVPFDRVTMILGDTRRTPDQGPTIASATLQVTSVPLRQAAAQLRQLLLQLASGAFKLPVEQLRAENARVYAAANPSIALSYAELAHGQDLHVALDKKVRLKSVAESRYVGKAIARVDIPAKVRGELTYVHDLRLPGMLHGRVVRPPYIGADSSAPLGNGLLSVDKGSIAHLPGIVKLVVINDFIGIVAEREEQAIAAMRQLKTEWKPWAGLPDLSLDGLHAALDANPKTDRVLRDDPGVDAALAALQTTVNADYVWPYHQHASIGPSCAVADVKPGRAEVWSGTQNPHDLRKDIARLLGLPPAQVDINRMEASGCYGRNCADDVSADAALLSQAIGRPVRVQLMREQESGWEPKGTGQLIRVRGGLDAQGQVAAYELKTSYPSNNAVTLPLVLAGKVANRADVQQMGDRTAIPQYEYPNMRVVCQDAAPIVRASWMRGVSALPNVFAHESWIDELAWRAGQDPIAFRLRYLKDPRALALIDALKRQADWRDGPAHRQPRSGEEVVSGRGFAYARYFHSKFPGFGAAWAAWVCDLSVNRRSGQIKLDKIFVAHDCGRMINPAGVRHQVHGNVIQSASRVLKEFVTFDKTAVTSLDWGGYPILRFDELPQVDIQLLDYPDEAPMGAGESASVPSAAAIANALFDALGVRLREVPFTPERVLNALAARSEQEKKR